jgi:hypothetical protein
MHSDNKNSGQRAGKGEKENTKSGVTSQDFDKLSREADNERTRKPGSQSNSSKQGNNGRGGGK